MMVGALQVSAHEVAGAVERLLARLDVPLVLEQKQLLESVLDLKARLKEGSKAWKQVSVCVCVCVRERERERERGERERERERERKKER